MLAFVRNEWKRCPVTILFVAAAAGLYAAVVIHELLVPENAAETMHVLGAATLRVKLHNGRPIDEFTGPFALWDGELWRVPVSGFHHATWWHLFFNCLSLWYLGRLLEPRLNRFRYAAFFMYATTLTIGAQLLSSVESMVVGLSGTVYAIFGVLLIVRQGDRELEDLISDVMIGAAILWLIVCLILTRLDLLPVANIAHFVGFGYGCLVGFVMGKHGTPVRARMLLAAHLVIVPVLWFVAHPTWNGCYHWRLAEAQQDMQAKKRCLERAVACNPKLPRVWARLAVMYWDDDQQLRAWSTVVKAIDQNRTSNRSLCLIANWMWWQLDDEDIDKHHDAVNTLMEVFGQDAVFWFEQLGLGRTPQPRATDGDDSLAELPESQDAPPGARPEDADAPDTVLPAPDGPRPNRMIDPDHPWSAQEGITI